MTVILKCANIKKSFGDHQVLKEVNFHVQAGERIGLVGRNGAGKTTLANILMKEIQLDSGSVIWNGQDATVGYLVQSTYYTSGKMDPLFVQDRKSIQGFFKSASQLGLKKAKEWTGEKFQRLSGGEKTKMALANLWSEMPELLIMDEPTNHLDFQGLQWLIEEVRAYDGAVLMISHDRYFLDQTADRILELEDGRIENYQGNYTVYQKEKERRYASRMHAFVEQEKRKRKVEEEIKRLQNWSEQSHRGASKKAAEAGRKKGGKEHYRVKAKKKDKQVKSKLKRIEKIKREGIEKPKEEQRIQFAFGDAEKKGKRIIEAREIEKSYSEKVLFRDSSFVIQRGDRIGLFGENGCGKTTLIKAIMGEMKLDAGEIVVSASAQLGVMTQDVLDLPEKETVVESFKKGVKADEYEVRTLLANLGVGAGALMKKIGQLSLGERVRIKLAKVILSPSNFLILDEPCNHLDLPCREMLEEALDAYTGTILLASHDRYMLERLCNQLLVFENGRVKRIEGKLSRYLLKEQKRQMQPVQERKLLLENRMVSLMGELSRYRPEDPEYRQLAAEFDALLAEKRAKKGEG